jgi:hypothetical protein
MVILLIAASIVFVVLQVFIASYLCWTTPAASTNATSANDLYTGLAAFLMIWTTLLTRIAVRHATSNTLSSKYQLLLQQLILLLLHQQQQFKKV